MKTRIREDRDQPLLVHGEFRGQRGLLLQDPDTGRLYPEVRGSQLNPVAHPLGAPTYTGSTVTVDTLLNQPTRITAFLMDITLQRFLLDRLFTSAGGVSGGAVVYDQATVNELYLDRDVQRVAPGAEFPVVTSSRRAPRVAEVEKYGGKFWFSDEARDRNQAVAFRNESVKLGNTIVRKLNTIALATVEAAITGNGGSSNFTGNDWSAAIPNGSNPTAPALTPGADFAKANLLADQAELGIRYNIAIVNPVQLNELRLFYGSGLGTMLDDMGFDEVFASNRVTVGTAYFIAEGQLGEIRLEQPLATETWREQATQRTWVQSSVRPVMYVTNPFAVMKATGL